ncbi:MAG: hypothetical protein WKG06_15670 [Segetibacter sp.]
MEWKLKRVIYNLSSMVYSELPEFSPRTYRTTQKKHISIITPDKILLNEKLMLGLMFTGIAMVLITWAVRKR